MLSEQGRTVHSLPYAPFGVMTARKFVTVPHTIRELAERQLFALAQGKVTPEEQPYAASVLDGYIKQLMIERVYKGKAS